MAGLNTLVAAERQRQLLSEAVRARLAADARRHRHSRRALGDSRTLAAVASPGTTTAA